MGTLKSVCSSWSGLISRDINEHTHLRTVVDVNFDTVKVACCVLYKVLIIRNSFQILSNFKYVVSKKRLHVVFCIKY